MIKKLRDILFASEFADLQKQREGLEMEVNRRVADYLAKMDPFEPLLRKYNVIFSEEYDKPEANLNSQSQFQMFSWAYAQVTDPSYRHLMNWLRNKQGNATLQKGTHDGHYLYGRAAVATITLLVEEVSRLASRYKDIMAEKTGEFDRNLPVD